MPITPDDIRQRMDQLGISQAELAQRAGMHTSTLSQILAGRRAIGMETADRLAAALDSEVTLAARAKKANRKKRKART